MYLPTPVPSQFVIVKALRNCGKGFETRIILADPSLASWTVTSLSGTSSDAAGGYEIKKTCWDVLRSNEESPNVNWDDCSIYVVSDLLNLFMSLFRSYIYARKTFLHLQGVSQRRCVASRRYSSPSLPRPRSSLSRTLPFLLVKRCMTRRS